MSDSYSIALSGMNANAARMAAAASNIANMRTSGSADAPQTAYQAVDTVFSTSEGGGVSADVVSRDPATVTTFSPSDPQANAEGLVAMPNVDLNQEMVESMMAVTGYKANAEALKTLSVMDRALLDIKA